MTTLGQSDLFDPVSGQHRSQVVINPNTGEIKNVTQSEYAELSDEWKQTSPTLEQMREAGMLSESGETVGTSIGKLRFAQQSPEGIYDPEYQKAVGDLAPFRSTSEDKTQDAYNVRAAAKAGVSEASVSKVFGGQAYKEALRPEGYYEIDPDTGVKTWIDPSAIESGVKPTYEEATKRDDEVQKATTAQAERETVRRTAEAETYTYTDPETGQKNTVDRSAQISGAALTANEFEASEYGQYVRAREKVDEYGDPFRALASGLSVKEVEAAGYDMTTKDKDTGQSPLEWYQGLNEAQKITIRDQGMEGYNKQVNEARQAFESKHVEDPKSPGDWYKKDWDQEYVKQGFIPSEKVAQKLFAEGGMQGVTQYLGAVEYEQNMAAKTGLEYTQTADIADQFAKESTVKQADILTQAITQGQTDETASGARKRFLSYGFDEDTADRLVQYRNSPDINSQNEIVKGITEPQIETAMAKMTEEERYNVLNNYAASLASKKDQPLLDMIPIYGTIRSVQKRGWGSGWTVLSAVGDAAIFTSVIKGAAAGARSVGYPSKMERVKGAVRGAVSSLIPDDLSIQLPKGDVLRPGYRPLAALEVSTGTVRLPAAAVGGDVEKALRIRDKLMELYVAGKKPVIVEEGVTYKLNPPLLKGAGHATPDVKWLLEEGAAVEAKPGMAAKEQGLFVGVGTHSRFVPSSAFGKTVDSGEPGVVLFGKSAIKTVSSGKLYRGTGEMERVFPVGTTLAGLKRAGFSRTAQGQKFTIIVEADNVNRLKAIAARVMEPYLEVKSIYTPAIEVKGAKKWKLDLVAEARAYDDAAENAARAGKDKLAATLRAEASAMRTERLTRPMTANSARSLASEYTRISQLAAARADELSRSDIKGASRDAEVLRRATESIERTAEYLRAMSNDKKLIRDYNVILRGATPQLRIVELPRRKGESDRSYALIRVEPKRETPSLSKGPIRTTSTRPSEETRRISPPERISPPRADRPPSRDTERPRAEPPSRIPPPGGGPPDKGKVQPPSAEIELVEGLPWKPGEVLWDQGIVWVEAAPPSPDDIQKGKRGQVRILRVAPEDARIKDGTPERTLFKRGKAPRKMVVRIGATRATVIKGQKISFSRFTGGGSIMQRGRRGVITSKERSVMKGKRR